MHNSYTQCGYTDYAAVWVWTHVHVTEKFLWKCVFHSPTARHNGSNAPSPFPSLSLLATLASSVTAATFVVNYTGALSLPVVTTHIHFLRILYLCHLPILHLPLSLFSHFLLPPPPPTSPSLTALFSPSLPDESAQSFAHTQYSHVSSLGSAHTHWLALVAYEHSHRVCTASDLNIHNFVYEFVCI